MTEFHRVRRDSEDRRPDCKRCRSTNLKYYLVVVLRDKLAAKGLQKCRTCHGILPFEQFFKNSLSANGTGYSCKKCSMLKRKAWAAANKERMRELHRSDYQKHREERNRKQSLRTQKNRVKRNAYIREYRRRRPEIDKAVSSARRAAKRNSQGSFTPDEFYQLCQFFRGMCLMCWRKDKTLTPDHIRPLSKKGANVIGNIQPLCGRCNSVKYTQWLDLRPLGQARLTVEDFLGSAGLISGGYHEYRINAANPKTGG